MSQLVLGAVLIGHGLITAVIGFGAVTNPGAPAMALPSWFSWWPGPFGRSWLFDAIGAPNAVASIGGLLWLLAGVGLTAGGLAWLGIGPISEYRDGLLVGGAALGLLALALYFHPLYAVAVVINLALLALLWGRLTPAS